MFVNRLRIKTHATGITYLGSEQRILAMVFLSVSHQSKGWEVNFYFRYDKKLKAGETKCSFISLLVIGA